MKYSDLINLFLRLDRRLDGTKYGWTVFALATSAVLCIILWGGVALIRHIGQ